MARLKCAKCGKEKGLFSGMVEPWYRCPNCGVICNDCDSGSSVGAALGVSKKRCSKCGDELQALK